MKTLNWIYFIWFSCGYVLIITDLLPNWLEWANSIYLILGGLITLYRLKYEIGWRHTFYFFVICGGLSLFSEWFGVHTGLWFGNYSYTSSFAPFIAGVPIAIPMAWCMVLLISRWAIPGHRLLDSALAASFAVAIDLLLDPVAVVQTYWIWQPVNSLSLYQVPWTNFASWWVTAFIILWTTNRLMHSNKNISLIVNYTRFSWPELKLTILRFDYSLKHTVRLMFQNTMLLSFITLELLFSTIAIIHQLWFAIVFHVLLILIIVLIQLFRSKMK